jgi:adenine-specific DNA-methyltransferase
MATGIPKKSSSRKNAGMSLSYTGKMPEEEILATVPSEAVEVWRHPESKRNCLYFGDNLGILALLLGDVKTKGNIRLVYIDPPFSTQSTFYSRAHRHAYDDTLGGAEYVEFLRRRLVLIRELLADDGSIYVHLDEKMLFHTKVVMDEVFGEENYRNCITRKKCNPKNYTRKTYGNVADYILFYTKTSEYVWNRPLEPWTEERAKEYQYVEPETGRRYMKVPVHAPGIRRGETGKAWRGMLPPAGKHWQYPPAKLDQMNGRGEIFWSPTGNPRRKVYLDESAGIGIQDIWLDFRDAHNQNIRITGYPTEKNPELVRRIIEASSNPNDIVMDCFSGSGTTLAVANELGRHWIGVENSLEAIKTTLRRLEKGTEPMGDYVPSKANRNKQQEEQAMLFLSYDSPSDIGTTVHEPVLEFSIMSSKDSRAEIHPVVEKWRSRVSKYLKACHADSVALEK